MAPLINADPRASACRLAIRFIQGNDKLVFLRPLEGGADEPFHIPGVGFQTLLFLGQPLPLRRERGEPAVQRMLAPAQADPCHEARAEDGGDRDQHAEGPATDTVCALQVDECTPRRTPSGWAPLPRTPNPEPRTVLS